MTAVEFNTRLLAESKGLKNFAFSLTRNRDDAQDLLQDTFLKAISYRQKFRDHTNLRAWLFTIMRNTFINTYHREQHTRRLITTVASDSWLKLNSSTHDNNSECRLYAKQIVRHIEQLPAEYQLPFASYYSGFKYEEIAAKLSLPLGTIKSRIHMARKILMHALHSKWA